MNKKYRDIERTLSHSVYADNKDSPSLEDAVKYIEKMSFDEIIKKISTPDPLISKVWSTVEAEIAIQYYKNFLFLNKKYQETYPILPPLLEVDEIWHHHIMDTRKYIEDCINIFGYYFHHYPYFGARSEDDRKNLNVAFSVMQELHLKEFGSYMVSIWE